jgi:Tfp pilus assembly protein PilO
MWYIQNDNIGGGTMEQANGILSIIGELLDQGVPVAMLIMIGWLAVKYMPGLISGFKGLADSIAKNTAATTNLQGAFDRQVDKMAVVTVQLEELMENLDKVEAQQVKRPEFDNLLQLVYQMHQKVNAIHEQMVQAGND